MNLLILPLPGNETLASDVAANLGAEIGTLEVRCFPDEETYVRIESDLCDRNVALIASLDRPDEKVLPLIFAAATARDLGATSVGVVAPYLAYMRQDKRFNPGEALTSTYFAALLSAWVDWVVTIDPHLHRRSSLDEIYSVPTQVLHAAPLIAAWIKQNIAKPLLIGPDEESQQWVAAVAANADAPHVILKKLRHGDRDVEVTVPDLERWRDYTPVLVDDIISTARTMIETIGHLKRAGMSPPICIGVHGLFASGAFEKLDALAAHVVTTNTIPHSSNEIDTVDLIVTGIRAASGSL